MLARFSRENEWLALQVGLFFTQRWCMPAELYLHFNKPVSVYFMRIMLATEHLCKLVLKGNNWSVE